MRKNCFNDQEKLLKFEAEDREFANILRSLELFFRTVNDQNNFWWPNARKIGKVPDNINDPSLLSFYLQISFKHL